MPSLARQGAICPLARFIRYNWAQLKETMSIVHVVRTPEPASLPLRRTSVSLVESTACAQPWRRAAG